jgi:hypothetical protein
MLDPVPPETLFPVYDRIYDTLREQGILERFRGVHDSTFIALDGTWYHSSSKIHCPCCSTLEHPNGAITYDHENENNNTLKTKGYHLEHNFGHGQQHLASLLAAMNILAFLCHTVLGFTDDHYRLIRATLPTRKTCFQDVRALLRYLHFPRWQGLLRFMMRGLEIGPYAQPT